MFLTKGRVSYGLMTNYSLQVCLKLTSEKCLEAIIRYDNFCLFLGHEFLDIWQTLP